MFFKRKTKSLFSLLDLDPWDYEVCDNNAVKRAVLRDPESARLRYHFDRGGFGRVYPIYVAVSLEASREVVELLHDACPLALQPVCTLRWTTLHHACHWRAPIDVVQFLVEKRPAALAERDNGGNTPLHVVSSLSYGAAIDLIRLLINGYPSALGERNSKGKTPLHLACCNKAPYDVVRVLASRCPAALMMRDDADETPPDIATHLNAPRRLQSLLTKTQALVDIDPKDISMVLKRFVEFWKYSWWGGIAFLLQTHPTVVHNLSLDTKLIPHLLFRVGRECGLNHLYRINVEMPSFFTQKRNFSPQKE